MSGTINPRQLAPSLPVNTNMFAGTAVRTPKLQTYRTRPCSASDAAPLGTYPLRSLPTQPHSRPPTRDTALTDGKVVIIIHQSVYSGASRHFCELSLIRLAVF